MAYGKRKKKEKREKKGKKEEKKEDGKYWVKMLETGPFTAAAGPMKKSGCGPPSPHSMSPLVIIL